MQTQGIRPSLTLYEKREHEVGIIWMVMAMAAAPSPSEAEACIYGEALEEGEPCPLTNPGSWISTNDYPPSSLRDGEQGTVAFTLEVDAEGRPTECSIDIPTEYETLNAVTCMLVMERSRFMPSRNEAGEAIASSYSNQVRWQIPDQMAGLITILPHNHEFVVTVEPTGEISDCRIVGYEFGQLPNEIPADAGEAACQALINNGYMPIRPQDRGAYPRVYRMRSSVETEIRL